MKTWRVGYSSAILDVGTSFTPRSLYPLYHSDRMRSWPQGTSGGYKVLPVVVPTELPITRRQLFVLSL
jgi:hypothetical protein